MTQLLPRFTDEQVEHDPLAAHIAQLEAEEARARAAVERGHTPDADPADLRGIPCIGRGVGGTSPGTNPLTETVRRLSRRNP
jgi:hypothetical protein